MTEPNRALLALVDWKMHRCLPDEETIGLVIEERNTLDSASKELTELIKAWQDHHDHQRRLQAVS